MQQSGTRPCTSHFAFRTPHFATSAQRRRRPLRGGFSLLEVVLALALLVGAIAVTGELVRSGHAQCGVRAGPDAGQLICESKLAEITPASRLPEAVSFAEYELDPEWVYSVELASVDVPGLVLLRVTVAQNLAPVQRPVEFSLTRLIQDPGVELAPARNRWIRGRPAARHVLRHGEHAMRSDISSVTFVSSVVKKNLVDKLVRPRCFRRALCGRCVSAGRTARGRGRVRRTG